MNQRKTKRKGTAGVLAALLLISGCASKEDTRLFENIRKESPELRTLQQTEKAIFERGDANETIVIATYLPEASRSSERFVVAVYPEERLDRTHAFLLNDEAPLSRRQVSRDTLPRRIRRTLPPWFVLYRLDFPRTDKTKLLLTIRNVRGEKRELAFYKGPKYLSTKPHPRF